MKILTKLFKKAIKQLRKFIIEYNLYTGRYKGFDFLEMTERLMSENKETEKNKV